MSDSVGADVGEAVVGEAVVGANNKVRLHQLLSCTEACTARHTFNGHVG